VFHNLGWAEIFIREQVPELTLPPIPTNLPTPTKEDLIELLILIFEIEMRGPDRDAGRHQMYIKKARVGRYEELGEYHFSSSEDVIYYAWAQTSILERPGIQMRNITVSICTRILVSNCEKDGNGNPAISWHC